MMMMYHASFQLGNPEVKEQLFLGDSLYDETYDDENLGIQDIQSDKIQIPLILHRHWISHDIPSIVAKIVRSWRKHEPPLEHWFWPELSLQNFILNSLQQMSKEFNFTFNSHTFYVSEWEIHEVLRYLSIKYIVF